MRTREKENRSKETKPESTHPAIFFFVKQKEDLAGGTTAAKTSPPLGGRSGIAGTRASEELGTGAIEEPSAGASKELIPDDRLLQKKSRPKSKQRGGIQQQENKKTTHRRIRGTSSSSSSSVSTKATKAPAEKGTKVLGSRQKQEDKGTECINMLT